MAYCGFTFALMLIMYGSAQSCGEFLRNGLMSRDICPHVNNFATCLVNRHKAMGSPLGPIVERKIGAAVRSSVKQLCNADCPDLELPGKLTAFDDLDTLVAGNEVKVCAFDVIMEAGAKRKGVCERIEDVAECIIAASTDASYLMTKEVVDVATYLMAETLKISLGIKCPKPALKLNLKEKCMGFRQLG